MIDTYDYSDNYFKRQAALNIFICNIMDEEDLVELDDRLISSPTMFLEVRTTVTSMTLWDILVEKWNRFLKH